MTPALRAANLVAAAPPVLDQLALATFIDRGWYDAHLRASRRRFRARRDLLVRTLGDQVPEGRVAGTAAGLHILLHLPDGADIRGAVRAAAAAGLRLTDLDDYRAHGSTEPRARPRVRQHQRHGDPPGRRPPARSVAFTAGRAANAYGTVGS